MAQNKPGAFNMKSVVVPQQKKIAVVTSTRADYGLLAPVLAQLSQNALLQPLLVVTGMHLEPAFGNTVREVEAGPVPIAAKLPILQVAKAVPSAQATAAVIAHTETVFASWFDTNKLDAVLLLGDRFEIFAVAVAAAVQRIPVCHISGGDSTLGAADEWYRHSISKLSALHFPSCAESAARLVRMGEPPERVFCVGGLGDENLRTTKPLSRKELFHSLKALTAVPEGGLTLPENQPFGLVTFHPETTGESPEAQCQALCGALAATPGVFWLITAANADAGGEICNRMLQEFAASHAGHAAFVPSLGALRYLSALHYAAAVVGNSSSGVVETPSLGVPTVNIGSRQKGRPICRNVLCCPAEKAAIIAALQKALSPGFVKTAKTAVSPYNGGATAARMVRILAQQLNTKDLRAPKPFYDGPVPAFDPLKQAD